MTSSFGAANRVPLEVITYWAPTAPGDDNEVGHAAPILIWGRWTVQFAEIQSAQGEILVSKAQVIVDREVEESGFLARGDQRVKTNPSVFADAQEIQGYTSRPDLRYLEQVKRAYL